MSIKDILEVIEKDPTCRIVERMGSGKVEVHILEDLQYFYEKDI